MGLALHEPVIVVGGAPGGQAHQAARAGRSRMLPETGGLVEVARSARDAQRLDQRGAQHGRAIAIAGEGALLVAEGVAVGTERAAENAVARPDLSLTRNAGGIVEQIRGSAQKHVVGLKIIHRKSPQLTGAQSQLRQRREGERGLGQPGIEVVPQNRAAYPAKPLAERDDGPIRQGDGGQRIGLLQHRAQRTGRDAGGEAGSSSRPHLAQ